MLAAPIPSKDDTEDSLRHATFARWSNQSSFVHRLDARVKLILLLAFVISLALLRSPSVLQLISCLALLVAIAWAARLPALRILRTSFFVVPFVGLFSLIVYLSGDTQRACSILAKSYLSALSVLVCVSSAPLPQLLAAAQFLHVPGTLIEVTQLIYRYLFVLSAQAHVMQTAFHARAGRRGRRAIRASSGMVAVLFGRSYEKAASVHQAMCGRGFSGILTRHEFKPFQAFEVGVLTGGFTLAIALHFI